MFIVIISLCIIGIIASIIWSNWDEYSDGAIAIRAVSISLLVIASIATCIVATENVKSGLISDKITVCQECNADIEDDLKAIVWEYAKFETDTYKELSMDDVKVVINMYPELKTNEMVLSLMSTYKSNNEEIKNYRLKQIDASVLKWWLYFGK